MQNSLTLKYRDELKWMIPLAVVCLLVFANSLSGEFVYDDTRQIVRNTLIQDSSLWWKALTSDVWAFKGDGSQVASNYWRPTFTLLNIVCFRLFGMNPFGWHVVNLLLHTGVTLLSFLLLRRWSYTNTVAFVIALLFAVHPVHVESVAWVAGSPDLLFSISLLGSLWFATSYRVSRSNLHLALTVLLYAAALGSKEIGILCLPIYYFVLKSDQPESPAKPVSINLPLILISGAAVAYFLIRLSIIGAVARPPDDPVATVDALFSIPSMFAFYLKQIFAPVYLAINYPLSPASQPSLLNFVIPLVVSIAAIAGIGYLVRASDRARLAAAVFLLPMIPALNATAFPTEQIVHDRYLYLPLLGALMLIVPIAVRFISEKHLLIAGIVMSAILSFQTFTYNRAFANELALWTWTSKIDNSSFTAMQYGGSLAEADRDADAVDAFSRAIDKRPVPRAYIGRGRSYTKLKQYDKAESDLLNAVAAPPDKSEAYALYQAYESLGIVYTAQRKLDAAIRNFTDARSRLPIYSAALTVNLAIVQYQSGQKDAALRELEGARDQARRELLPESKSVFLRLGMLYAELGRKDDARASLSEYLKLTAAINDKLTIDDRSQAAKLLGSLK